MSKREAKVRTVSTEPIAIYLIDPSPHQKRRVFSGLTELAASIDLDGLIEPIVVRQINGRYELIAGERRWRASQLIEGNKTVLARIVEATNHQARRMCAAENMQRSNLSAIEEVEGIVEIVDAELLPQHSEYERFGPTALDRVKALLSRLDTERRHQTGRYVNTANKFIGSIDIIFSRLPNPIDWHSFFMNDLPLITSIDEDVAQFSAEKRLNKSQVKQTQKLKDADTKTFEDIKNTGKTTVLDEDFQVQQVEFSDLSSREISKIAQRAEAEKTRQQMLLWQRQVDDLPEKIAPAIQVKHGDWWRLGTHRLYCGDTSKPEFYERVPQAAFAFADPPYNAGVADWDNDFNWGHDWLISKGDVVAVTPGIASLFDFAKLTSMPYKWSATCWIDNGMTRGAMGYGNWVYIALFSHDSLYRQAQDIIRVSIKNSERERTEHKGRKPAALISRLVELYAPNNGAVIDPFLGSGTTLLVSEKLNSPCWGGEIDPVFCASIIQQWQKMTGQKAIKE